MRYSGQHGPVEDGQLKDRVELSTAKLTAMVNLLEQAGAVRVDPDGRLQYPRDAPPPARAVDRLTVLFEQAGYKTLSLETVLRRGLLSKA